MTLIVCAASSVYAGTLMITKKDLGGSKVAIGYSASSADCIPAAFALQCTLTGGTVSPSSVLSFSNVFNAFPDYIYSNPMGYYFGVGMPLTVKRYREEGPVAWLIPENPDFEPIRVDLQESAVVIEGVVVGVVRNHLS